MKRIPFEKCESGNFFVDIYLLKIMKINEIEESNPIIILSLSAYKLL